MWREGGHDGAGLTSVSLEACTRKHADTSKKQSTVSQSCMLRPAQVYIHVYNFLSFPGSQLLLEESQEFPESFWPKRSAVFWSHGSSQRDEGLEGPCLWRWGQSRGHHRQDDSGYGALAKLPNCWALNILYVCWLYFIGYHIFLRTTKSKSGLSTSERAIGVWLSAGPRVLNPVGPQLKKTHLIMSGKQLLENWAKQAKYIKTQQHPKHRISCLNSVGILQSHGFPQTNPLKPIHLLQIPVPEPKKGQVLVHLGWRGDWLLKWSIAGDV